MYLFHMDCLNGMGPIASMWLHSNGHSLYVKLVCLGESYVNPVLKS